MILYVIALLIAGRSCYADLCLSLPLFLTSQDITGPNITDGVFAMYGADLGIPRWDDSRRAMAVMFGDNFEFKYMKGIL